MISCEIFLAIHRKEIRKTKNQRFFLYKCFLMIRIILVDKVFEMLRELNECYPDKDKDHQLKGITFIEVMFILSGLFPGITKSVTPILAASS